MEPLLCIEILNLLKILYYVLSGLQHCQSSKSSLFKWSTFKLCKLLLLLSEYLGASRKSIWAFLSGHSPLSCYECRMQQDEVVWFSELAKQDLFRGFCVRWQNIEWSIKTREAWRGKKKLWVKRKVCEKTRLQTYHCIWTSACFHSGKLEERLEGRKIDAWTWTSIAVLDY